MQAVYKSILSVVQGSNPTGNLTARKVLYKIYRNMLDVKEWEIYLLEY